MGRLRFADQDAPGWRKRERRIADDQRFIAAVRACATLDDVRVVRRAQRPPIPEWRHVALLRAVKRVCLNGGEK